ncbi:MAG TPA: hypothetical protein DEB39_03605 [Planctomycetaceae bacterium]|nr:hypothetical protein [Planctomycetaceae bacterium]
MDRNFRFLKQFRRVATRYDKLDATCDAFVAITNCIVLMNNQCQHNLNCAHSPHVSFFRLKQKIWTSTAFSAARKTSATTA